MSELKYQLMLNKNMSWVPCYLKSEADKVIAELEEKLKVQTSIAEEGWKNSGTYHTSYAEAVKELYDKNKEIAELKEERRWRPVSEELPKLEEDVGEIFLVAVEVESNARSNASPRGSYVTSAEFCNGEWYNDTTGSEIEENIERDEGGLFYRSKVTHWRPLPEAPELAEKFKEA